MSPLLFLPAFSLFPPFLFHFAPLLFSILFLFSLLLLLSPPLFLPFLFLPVTAVWTRLVLFQPLRYAVRVKRVRAMQASEHITTLESREADRALLPFLSIFVYYPFELAQVCGREAFAVDTVIKCEQLLVAELCQPLSISIFVTIRVRARIILEHLTGQGILPHCCCHLLLSLLPAVVIFARNCLCKEVLHCLRGRTYRPVVSHSISKK
mmetsp:Transcript_33891/g.87000  ORF Transcript_33891/g.87000 Transcript_33891/m.87000 type:complete len:209 (-) Transcript_33891:734-1360(-)